MRWTGLDWPGVEKKRTQEESPRNSGMIDWLTWTGLPIQFIYICATCNATLVIIIAHSCPHICCMNDDDDDQLPSLQLQRNHWISGLMPANSLVCVETWQSILNFTQRSATDEWMNDDRATTHPQTYLVCAGEVWRWLGVVLATSVSLLGWLVSVALVLFCSRSSKGHKSDFWLDGSF